MSITYFSGPAQSSAFQAVSVFNGTVLGQLNSSGRLRTGNGYGVLSQTGLINKNSTNAVDLTFTVPANSQIIDIIVDVLTAFDSATTATLTVGTASAGTQYAESVDAKTAGRVRPDFSAAQLAAMDDVGSNTSVIATVTPDGATTAGQVRVTILYTV